LIDWRITAEIEDKPPPRWRDLPKPLMAEVTGPEHYIAHSALLDAINTALALGQPLLVTGEPGCGKTELGDFVAWKLGLGRAIHFLIKTDMQARDLFYTFDTVGRFHAAQSGARQDGAGISIEAVNFINYHGLGEAIVRASKPGAFEQLLPPGFVHSEQRRSVVLIDEIDKAPRDVPNDLLAELEKPRFRIPELNNAEIAADETFRPILVLTSNSEKALPDAFLRRCVYYNIPFPDTDTLKLIVENRIGNLPRDAGLVSDAITVMTHLRQARHLRKRPGTAELLGFLLALRNAGFRPGDRLGDDKRWSSLAAITLLKSREDQEGAESHLEEIAWPAEPRVDGGWQRRRWSP
jgi:MoxR-like ATPase